MAFDATLSFRNGREAHFNAAKTDLTENEDQ
jgi:hypothetical protein